MYSSCGHLSHVFRPPSPPSSRALLGLLPPSDVDWRARQHRHNMGHCHNLWWFALCASFCLAPLISLMKIRWKKHSGQIMLDKRKRRVGLSNLAATFEVRISKACRNLQNVHFLKLLSHLESAVLTSSLCFLLSHCLSWHVWSSRNRCGLRPLNEIGNVKTWRSRFLFLIPSCFGRIGGSKSSMFSHLLMTCWTSAQPHHRQLTLSATWHATDSGGVYFIWVRTATESPWTMMEISSHRVACAGSGKHLQYPLATGLFSSWDRVGASLAAAAASL